MPRETELSLQPAAGAVSDAEVVVRADGLVDPGSRSRASVLPADAAFEDFFEAERDRVFRALLAVTGSRQEAEDLAQEAFVRVWERWERVAAMENPAGYLHRTAMNLARSRYRRLMMAARRAAYLAPSTGPDAFAAAEDRRDVAAALARLSRRQRAAIVLTDWMGYPAEEAADLLGGRGTTVRSLRHQARITLRKEVDHP